MKKLTNLNEIHGGSKPLEINSQEELLAVLERLVDKRTGEPAINQIMDNAELCELIRDPNSFKAGYQFFSTLVPIWTNFEYQLKI